MAIKAGLAGVKPMLLITLERLMKNLDESSAMIMKTLYDADLWRD